MSDGEGEGDDMFAGDFDDFASAGPAQESEALGEGAPLDEEELQEEELRDEELSVLLRDDESCSEGEEDHPGDRPERGPEAQASGVVRVLHPREHMTSDMLSHVEVAKILATRAEQIARHNNAMLPPGVKPASFDPAEVAHQELVLGLCPLVIHRVRSHTGAGAAELVVEEHRVRDLLVPPEDLALYN